MTMQYELVAELREQTGKSANRRLRRESKVPAVLFGGGKPSAALVLDHNFVYRALQQEGFYSHILTVKVGKSSERAVLKDVQRNPGRAQIMHLDLQRVSETEKLHLHIPLHFLGEDVAPGVKQGGGIISHHMIEVEVSCLPKDLPEFIAVDISQLGLNEAVHLSDLNVPEAVELVELSRGAEHDPPVVSIHLPRVAVEEEEVAAAEMPAEGAAPAPAEGGES